MLTLHGISKTYRDVQALRNVIMKIDSNEIVGLIGKNGAGKTTLLEIIAGLIEPTAGEVFINGETDDDHELIGYLEDDPRFYENLTTKEIIHYYMLMQNKKISPSESDALLADFNLFEKRDVRIKELSRGMRQLLGFLLTMLRQPKIILLDEPFTGLDPSNMQMMKKKLRDLKDEGKSMIISTHILSFASDICDRVLFLDRGKIVYETGKGNVLTEKKLEQLFHKYVGSKGDS